MGDHTTGSCPTYLKGSAPDWGLREGGTNTAEAGQSEAYTGLEQPHTLPGHLAWLGFMVYPNPGIGTSTVMPQDFGMNLPQVRVKLRSKLGGLDCLA